MNQRLPQKFYERLQPKRLPKLAIYPRCERCGVESELAAIPSDNSSNRYFCRQCFSKVTNG